MEWLKSLFRKPEPISPVNSHSSKQLLTHDPARERAAVLTQTQWVEEQLTQCSIDRLLEVSGIREAHIKTLRNAGITNLREARECAQLPLMGGTADWASGWVKNHVFTLNREYQRHQKALGRAA